MSDTGDEADSRTASVGAQRARKKTKSTQSPRDTDSRPTKKRRRNQPAADRAVEDFVPRGASFSEKPLEVDPDETSSSGSGSGSGSDSDSDSDSDNSASDSKPAAANPHAGSTAPAVSWNQGRKNAVRTTLGKRKAQPQPQSKPLPSATSNQFKAVNGTYWRSRSDSASSAGSGVAKKDDAHPIEESTSEEGEMNSASDSEDSGSLDSEADDSILLNIGTKHEQAADEYDPETLNLDQNPLNGHANGISNKKDTDPLFGIIDPEGETKEEAFQRFSHKYPTAPVTLVDLEKMDFESQAMFLYWDRDIHTLDLQLPIGCIECLRQGHMAEVCPSKECEHCGAWNQHSSHLCPTWRRCIRCRERGHQEEQCTSSLKCSPSQVPCDICGQPHLETQCDQRCAFPMREPTASSIEVSLSCARCASTAHLIGDCPSVIYHSYSSSTFSLKGIDPTSIKNLSAGAVPKQNGLSGKAGPPPSRPPKGPRGKGRRGGAGGGNRSFSSDSSDDMPRGGNRPQPQSRGRGRGAIRFGGGLGSDQPRGKPPPRRNLSPLPRRGPPPAPRGGNRGRGAGRGGKRGRGR